MWQRWRRTALGISLGVALALQWAQPSALAKVEILPGTIFEADEQTAGEIVATFNRAEEAIQARDLDALMTFYSKGYSYHGLRKSDIRKVWAELFAHYRKIFSTHIFDNIKTVGPGTEVTAEVTCNGALWGTSAETGQRVTVDSWYGEVHYLVREDGGWRIRGNAGEAPTVLQFGTAPHPLF